MYKMYILSSGLSRILPEQLVQLSTRTNNKNNNYRVINGSLNCIPTDYNNNKNNNNFYKYKPQKL